MKIHSTLPQNENFFGYYARLIPVLFKIGLLSQAFSAAIETYILFAILRPKFEGVQAPGAAALFAALALVALLEIGLRGSAAFSVRAILHKKFSGLDLPMTAFIFALSGSLLLCSLALHIEGSKEAIEATSDGPTLETTDAVNNQGKEAEAALLRAFSQDSATVTAAYQAKVKAARMEGAAKVRAYRAMKGATSQGAAALMAKMEEKVARQEAERGSKLQEIQERKAAALQEIKQRQYTAEDGIEARNQKQRAKEEARVKKYGGYLSTFSVLTVVFFLLTIVLNEIYKKGAGIEEVVIASQHQFEPTLTAKLSTAVNDKIQAHARRAIERIEKSIPAPGAPLAPHPLFDYSGLKPERVPMQTRERAPMQTGRPINGKHNETAAQTGHRPGGDENGGLFVAARQTPSGGGGGNNQASTGNNGGNTGGGSLAAALLGIENSDKAAINNQGENSREIFYFVDKDKAAYTIEHNGKHYTLRDINSFITTYTRRADTARKMRNEPALKSREEALQYWQTRRAELLKKMEAAG